MPVLYVVSFVSLVTTYWVDKFMLLRFHRLTPCFTKHLSASVVRLFPVAVLIHVLLALFVFTVPNQLNARVVTSLGLKWPDQKLW